jgi:hypothetical protein
MHAASPAQVEGSQLYVWPGHPPSDRASSLAGGQSSIMVINTQTTQAPSFVTGCPTLVDLSGKLLFAGAQALVRLDEMKAASVPDEMPSRPVDGGLGPAVNAGDALSDESLSDAFEKAKGDSFVKSKIGA